MLDSLKRYPNNFYQIIFFVLLFLLLNYALLANANELDFNDFTGYRYVGIYQTIWKDRDNIKIVYCINNASPADHMPESMYNLLNRERALKVQGDGFIRMSVWNYNINTKQFSPEKNHKYTHPVVYRLSNDCKLIACYYRKSGELILNSTSDRQIYRINLKKHLNLVGKERKVSGFNPDFEEAYPLYVSDESMVVTTLYHLITISIHSKSIKVTEIRNIIRPLLGLSLSGTNMFLFSWSEIFKYKNDVVEHFLYFHNNSSSLTDVLMFNKEIYFLVLNASAEKSTLLKYESHQKTNCFIDNIRTTSVIDGCLFILRNINQSEMEALLFSPNGKPLLKQKVRRENETSYFPVIDKKHKRIGIFKTNMKSVRNIPMIFKY